jgi:purine-binding chemotaxis protein CheW
MTSMTTTSAQLGDERAHYLSVEIGGQTFGIPVLIIREVLGTRRIGRMPLAPPHVEGMLNLRGRIVTSIDSRSRLGLPRRSTDDPAASIIVAHDTELYSLTVDAVGDVLSVDTTKLEPNPTTLDPRWRAFAGGICRLDGRLMIVLDTDRFLDFATGADTSRRLSAA